MNRSFQREKRKLKRWRKSWLLLKELRQNFRGSSSKKNRKEKTSKGYGKCWKKKRGNRRNIVDSDSL